ncbi:hypothetical protein V1525DRAFT_397848 [Lipomyces kononenkoae]|uniref:Uncharacterized protein n=1 Tax=Lipomyces kononenkoae TaxID=34357 RepID=A0ACC3T7P6_LIPKO
MTQVQSSNAAAFLSTHLSTFDDYLTVILVDALYFWTPVHKVHPGSRPPRGPSPAILTDLLRAHAHDSSQTAVLSAFLALPSIKSYLGGLSQKPRLRHEFEAHARRYLAMYAATVPFELGTTERYRAVSRRSEACVLARKPIPAGTTIQHLSGKMVALSPQDRTDLKRDFSIIYSHRLGESCLMLGPCRFVNHDCNPNARFMAQGSHGVVAVVAIRKIEVQEEITVSYADNYFGKKNRECMCATCERKGKGFFAPSRPVLSKPISLSRSASESEATSGNDSETELDSDSKDCISPEDENGVRRHRTRGRKRRLLEMLELSDSSTSVSRQSSISRRSSSYSPQKDSIKTEEHVEKLGLTDDKGCRRSQRHLTFRARVKQDHEEIPASNYPRESVATKLAETNPVGEHMNLRRSPRKHMPTGIRQQSRKESREQESSCTKMQTSRISKRKKKRDVVDRRTGLSTPPLSVSESNDDPSDTEWDSDVDASLYDRWTKRIQASPALMYNAFWGTLADDNIGSNGKYPCNQQNSLAIEDNRDLAIPPFQARKCANKNCNVRFILARGDKGRSLETSCAEYVRKYDLKCRVDVVCVKCNRHAGIYGVQWPDTEISKVKADEESDLDHTHEQRRVPIEFVCLW